MEITVGSGSITSVVADTYAIQVYEGDRHISAEATAIDAGLGGTIAQMIADGLIKGTAGELTVLPAGRRLKAKRVFIVGLGKRGGATLDGMRERTGNLSRRFRDLDAGHVATSFQEITAALDPEGAGRTYAEAATMSLYRFDRHHTRAADRPTYAIERVTLVEPNARKAAAVRRGVEVGRILGEATNMARDLANEPANLMTPTIMAARAQQLAAETGLECKIIERAEAERLKMGSYLSVANGSQQPPKFIVLRHRGARGGRTLALIGKGITFDSGGISIKPALDMDRMKGDMSGAAAVIAAIGALARLKARVNVIAIAPCTENLPSGTATKPGDVVYAMDGTSIEVLNTDAEGRLVLADAIAYAKAQGASTLVDVATLTGAMGVALGGVRTGVFVNNDRLMADLERAAALAGEPVWRMPLDEDYMEQIRSDVADLKNTGGAPAGAITAAKFLHHFAGETPWAHFDIAGVMHKAADKGPWVKGMSGNPVRTLVHFALGRARAAE
ncbi:MAG: leucyl aminopeptidase [Dehalococcoidia bacterium]|nr:leucyl aminopeptidase [Dehalococcoidia bacterium]